MLQSNYKPLGKPLPLLFAVVPRWLYQEFFYRYRVLCTTKDIQRNDMRVTCENILSNLIKVRLSEDGVFR